MANVQLYLALGVPVLLNAIMFGLLMAYINAKFEGVNQRLKASTSASTICATSGALNCAASKT